MRNRAMDGGAASPSSWSPRSASTSVHATSPRPRSASPSRPATARSTPVTAATRSPSTPTRWPTRRPSPRSAPGATSPSAAWSSRSRPRCRSRSWRTCSDGDRDSLGLFQQRPSQGWGTPEQIRDPRYAARKFYDEPREGARLGEDAGHRRRAARSSDRPTRRRTRSGPTTPRCWPPRCLGRATGAVACTVPGKPAMHRRRRGRRADQGPDRRLGPAGHDGRRRAARPRGAGGRRAVGLAVRALAGRRTRPGTASSGSRFGGLQWSADDGSWTKIEGGGGAGQVVAEVFGDV